MGRSPCCDKMGLKKGPWTDDEDRILVSYIQAHGHSNWRALPKLAGLQRCGKSCRLRWMNYLRPDIKRGNFTEEEEEAIIYLHRLLGNRWSAIAARLPGRTDNEIKNVWHTHLKKRVQKKEDSNDPLFLRASGGGAASSSPSSEVSTSTTSASDSMATNEVTAAQNWENGLEVNDSFWADALAMDGSVTSANFSLDFQETALFPEDDELDYWINVLRDGGDMADIMFS